MRIEDVPPAPVVADAGYGVVTAWRDQLTLQEIPYMVGVTGETTVWPPGQAPLPPRKPSRTGRPPTRVRGRPVREGFRGGNGAWPGGHTVVSPVTPTI